MNSAPKNLIQDVEYNQGLNDAKTPQTPNKQNNTPPGGLISLIGSLFFGLVLSLVLVEVLCRVMLGQQKAVLPIERPKLFYLPENNLSKKEYFYSSQKPEGGYRIAIVGDSFTYNAALQIDDGLPKRLERFLNLNSCQPKVEVLNSGFPGLSTKDEIKVVEHTVENYSPDLVLLQITLNDASLTPYSKPAKKEDPKTFFGRILSHWKTLELVNQRIENTRSYRKYVDYHNKIFKDPKLLKTFQNALSHIKDIADKKGIKFAAIVFPMFSYKVDNTYPFFEITKTITDSLGALSVPVLDLTEAYRDIPADHLEVVPGVDGHPNELANRIASEQTLEWLGKISYIPSFAIPKLVTPDRNDGRRYLPPINENKATAVKINCSNVK